MIGFVLFGMIISLSIVLNVFGEKIVRRIAKNA